MQWNACTDQCSSGSGCFNNGDLSQRSNSVNGFDGDTVDVPVTSEFGCEDAEGRLLSFSPFFMDVRELDPPFDDKVTKLTYAGTSFPKVQVGSCDQNSYDEAFGSWKSPSTWTNGIAWANVRLRITGAECSC